MLVATYSHVAMAIEQPDRESSARVVSPRSASLRRSALRSSLAAELCRVRPGACGGRDTPAPPNSSEVETMLRQLFVCACIAAPACAAAQQPAVPDTARRDSARAILRGHALAQRLQVVTVTADACLKPAESRQAVAVTSARRLRARPRLSPWEILRQTAGVEVHIQGQGPGFASDASVRGFSSDHSTDLALWIDGVPVNEPVNGHAEGYNDWSLIFPQAIQDLDVIKGSDERPLRKFRVLRHRERAHARPSRWHAYMDQWRVRADTLRERRSRIRQRLRLRVALSVRVTCTRADGVRTATTTWGRDTCASCTISRATRPSMAAWSCTGLDGNPPGYLSEDEFLAHDYDIVSNPTDRGHKLRAQERASLRVLSGNKLWRSTIYATQGDWRIFLTIPPAGGQFEGVGSQTEEDDNRFGFGATSALTWQLSRAEVTLGAEGRFDQAHYQNWFTTNRVARFGAGAHSRASAGRRIVRAGRHSMSPLVCGSTSVRDTMRSTRTPSPDGERAPRRTRTDFSPKLGALVKLTNAVGLYANVSRGFRTTDGVIEDPSLPFITMWAYEGGLKLNAGPVSASAALFRMDLSNEQTFNPLTSGSSNGGASRHQGVELSLRAPIGKSLTLSGDWTFNDARYKRLIAQAEDDPTQIDTLSGFACTTRPST